MNEGDTAERTFSHAKSADSGIHIHHQKLEQKAQEKGKCIDNVCRKRLRTLLTRTSTLTWVLALLARPTLPCVTCRTYKKNLRPRSFSAIESLCRMLTSLVSFIESLIIPITSTSTRQVHANVRIVVLCTSLSLGTGKSFLIEAVRAQADAIWSLQSCDSLV